QHRHHAASFSGAGPRPSPPGARARTDVAGEAPAASERDLPQPALPRSRPAVPFSRRFGRGILHGARPRAPLPVGYASRPEGDPSDADAGGVRPGGPPGSRGGIETVRQGAPRGVSPLRVRERGARDEEE